MEDWDDTLRKAANKACNTLKSTELQRNYCKVGFYRGIIDGARFGQKEEVLEEPMEFDDIISSAEFLDNEIGFFDGNIDKKDNPEPKSLRERYDAGEISSEEFQRQMRSMMKHTADRMNASFSDMLVLSPKDNKARQEGSVPAHNPQRYLVVESVDGIVTRSQVAPSRKMAQAVESNFMDTQVRADSEYSILTLKEAREMGYNV